MQERLSSPDYMYIGKVMSLLQENDEEGRMKINQRNFSQNDFDRNLMFLQTVKYLNIHKRHLDYHCLFRRFHYNYRTGRNRNK